MSDKAPAPQAAAAQANQVVLAQGYLNYIGETRVYFLTPSLGWGLFLDISDESLKQQLLTAFANPPNYSVYIFFQGTTVNAVQIKNILPS
jgi:hypothetical protein